MSSTNANSKTTNQTNTKEANDIRIGMGTRVRNVVRYCNSILKEKTFKTLKFSAVGGAIGKLVSAVEVLKTVNSGLYQQNKLATVSYQSPDNKDQKNQILYPKMEVILSLDDFKDKNEGYQEKLNEDERKKLHEIFNQQPVRPRRRFGFRGRRGGFRGRRGGFRGRRGFRGFRARGRGFRRGGFRGNNRGRGPTRGNRGNNRGGNRGTK